MRLARSNRPAAAPPVPAAADPVHRAGPGTPVRKARPAAAAARRRRAPSPAPPGRPRHSRAAWRALPGRVRGTRRRRLRGTAPPARARRCRRRRRAPTSRRAGRPRARAAACRTQPAAAVRRVGRVARARRRLQGPAAPCSGDDSQQRGLKSGALSPDPAIARAALVGDLVHRAARARLPSWNGPYATRISRVTCRPRCAITLRTSRLRPSFSETLSQVLLPDFAVDGGVDRGVAHALHHHAAGEGSQRARVHRAMHPHAVAPGPAIGRQFQAARQGAVIGQQQQPLAVQVQPPDADDAGQASGSRSNTVGRPSGSRWVVTRPSGLW